MKKALAPLRGPRGSSFAEARAASGKAKHLPYAGVMQLDFGRSAKGWPSFIVTGRPVSWITRRS
jgi:hypothetical protein